MGESVAELQSLIPVRPRKQFHKHYEQRKDGCWWWTGRTTTTGYGRMKLQGKDTRAHRISWLLHKGAIPPGLNVLHRCDNRLCVNPDHLFLGTKRDNTLDMIAKGRHSHGPTHAQAVASGAQRGDQHWRRRLGQ